MVSSDSESVRLVKLEETERNFLANGYLLAAPSQPERPESSAGRRESREGRSQVVVVPLRSLRDEPAKLELKVFCEPSGSWRKRGNSNSGGGASGAPRVCRVYSVPIEVPKFAMFVLAAPEAASVGKTADERRKLGIGIRVEDSAKLNAVSGSKRAGELA